MGDTPYCIQHRFPISTFKLGQIHRAVNNEEQKEQIRKAEMFRDFLSST